ncbi:transcription factor s-ii (tfiis), central domain-containing protein [Toxoplasma gondii VAND]|uniref:Transcription factor s-ii (Tfiis), central domain-containing protein n=1 Tax=Toxoplasma gondii VAND TaxID=933077 RepID=A0A086QLE2_TOXGO|nr:transcription factor s-ii (tfiis), central domain-containing protein [Toxoplasma gondii VAND]
MVDPELMDNAESGAVDVEDLSAPSLDPPPSPSSPPSPRELARLEPSESPQTPPVCLFQLAGETFYLHDWVRLKSSGERDWVAQIVAYFPGSDSEKSGGVEDADGGSGGRILCRWGWDPRDLRREACPALPLQSYSRFEVIPAINFCDENPIQSIKAKVRVEKYEKWKRRAAFPPLVRCTADDEEDVDKDKSGQSGNAAQRDSDPGQTCMPSVLFYRHSHEIETGFHPSLVADVFRFKRISRSATARGGSLSADLAVAGSPSSGTKSEHGGDEIAQAIDLGSEGEGPAAKGGFSDARSGDFSAPTYRRYPSLRNPDVRHFFCCNCRSTFAPPDDVAPPVWPDPEEVSQAEGGRYLLDAGISASYHPAVLPPEGPGSAAGPHSAGEATGPSRQREEAKATPQPPQLKLLLLEEFRKSTGDRPLSVLSPVQLPFVWMRTPAEGDFIILCWKCTGKRRKRREESAGRKPAVAATSASRDSGVVNRRKRRAETEDEAGEGPPAGHSLRRRAGQRGEKPARENEASHALSQQTTAQKIAGDSMAFEETGQPKDRSEVSYGETGEKSQGEGSGSENTARSGPRQEDAEPSRKRRKAASGVARVAAAMAAAEASSDADMDEDSDADFVAHSEEDSGGRCSAAAAEPRAKLKRSSRVAGDAEPPEAASPSRKARKESAPANGTSSSSGPAARRKSSGTSAAAPLGSRRSSAGGGLLSGPGSGATRPGGPSDWQAGNQARVDRLTEAFRLGIRELEEEAKQSLPGEAGADALAATKASGVFGTKGAEGAAASAKAEGGEVAERLMTSPGSDSGAGRGSGGSGPEGEGGTEPSKTLPDLLFATAEACAKAVNAAFVSQHKTLDSRRQKQRFFELLSNLKRENNQELRKKVLTGQISVRRLVTLESAELAPSFVRKEREEERERHFRQAVLLHEAPAAALARLRKTHKGIEPVIEDPDLLQTSPPARGIAPPIITVEKTAAAAKEKRIRVRAETDLRGSSSPSQSSGSSSSDSDDSASASDSDGSESEETSGSEDGETSAESGSESESSCELRREKLGGGANGESGHLAQARREAASGKESGGTGSGVQEQLASLKRLFSQATSGDFGADSCRTPAVGGERASEGGILKRGDGDAGERGEEGTENDGVQKNRQQRERRVAFSEETHTADGPTGKGIVSKSKKRRHTLARFSSSASRSCATLPRLPELLPNPPEEDGTERAGNGRENGRKGEAAAARAHRQSSVLGVPLDCSSLSPDACKDRVRHLLERVPLVGMQPPPSRPGNEDGEGLQTARTTPLLDYKAVVASMFRYLNVAFDRVTLDLQRR